MKQFYAYLMGPLLVLGMAGCSKDDPTPAAPAVSAKTALLATPKWRISAIVSAGTIAGQTIPPRDSFSGQSDCIKDNFWKFDTNLTVTQDEGALRCSPTAAQSRQATWSFNAAETEITIVDSSQPVGSLGHTVQGELLQLTSTTMQIRVTNNQPVNGFSSSVTATTTYTAF